MIYNKIYIGYRTIIVKGSIEKVWYKYQYFNASGYMYPDLALYTIGGSKYRIDFVYRQVNSPVNRNRTFKHLEYNGEKIYIKGKRIKIDSIKSVIEFILNK